VVYLICFKTNHVQIHKSTALLSIFSIKLHLKAPFEIAGVSDVTNDLVTNQVNKWISELVGVSGGGAHLHIHRTPYTK